MDEENRPVYCPRCGRIVQAGDRFCGVCGERITPDAQDATPTQEIPTVVQPPPSVPVRQGNRTLTVILGLGAVLAVVLAVGAIVGLNLLGRETAGQGGAEPKPPKSEENKQSSPEQDEGSETLSDGDSVEVRGIKTTLNDVHILPATDL